MADSCALDWHLQSKPMLISVSGLHRIILRGRNGVRNRIQSGNLVGSHASTTQVLSRPSIGATLASGTIPLKFGDGVWNGFDAEPVTSGGAQEINT
jgi:hypothetical protein